MLNSVEMTNQSNLVNLHPEVIEYLNKRGMVLYGYKLRYFCYNGAWVLMTKKGNIIIKNFSDDIHAQFHNLNAWTKLTDYFYSIAEKRNFKDPIQLFKKDSIYIKYEWAKFGKDFKGFKNN